MAATSGRIDPESFTSIMPPDSTRVVSVWIRTQNGHSFSREVRTDATKGVVESISVTSSPSSRYYWLTV
jgi:hypothetical protein